MFLLSAGLKRRLLSLDFSADVEDFIAKFSNTTFVFNVVRDTETRKLGRLQSFLFYFRFSIAEKHWNLKTLKQLHKSVIGYNFITWTCFSLKNSYMFLNRKR